MALTGIAELAMERAGDIDEAMEEAVIGPKEDDKTKSPTISSSSSDMKISSSTAFAAVATVPELAVFAGKIVEVICTATGDVRVVALESEGDLDWYEIGSGSENEEG